MNKQNFYNLLIDLIPPTFHMHPEATSQVYHNHISLNSLGLIIVPIPYLKIFYPLLYNLLSIFAINFCLMVCIYTLNTYSISSLKVIPYIFITCLINSE